MTGRTAGIIMYSDHKNKGRFDLTLISNKLIRETKWNPIPQIVPWDILFDIPGGGKVRIRDDGTIFYYKNIEGSLSLKILNYIWSQILYIIKKLDLTVDYENCIYISMFSESPEKFFEESRRAIQEFSNAVLERSSQHVLSDETSTLVMVVPVPKTVPANCHQLKSPSCG